MANFYELTTIDGVTAMVNMEAIDVVFEDGDNYAVHTADLVLILKKEDFMAALVAANCGFFKFAPATTEEVEEEVKEVEGEVV